MIEKIDFSKINSSVINFAAYDKTNEILLIVFNSASIWMYYDVPEDVYRGLVSAESAGKYFNLNIKHKYADECLHKKEISVG